MKKLIFVVAGIMLSISMLYAGVASWIDYENGKFGCSDTSFQGHLDKCNKNSSSWRGYQNCQFYANLICET